VLLASDGATSVTVAGEQLGRLRRLGVIPTLATVTVGGNDLLATYGATGAAGRAIKTVADNGRRLLDGLRGLLGPAAPIVVATVYDPSDGSGDADRLGLPSWPEALELLAELNQVLRTLPKTTRRWWRMCMAGSSAMAWPPATPPGRPPDPGLWDCDLIEPNAWGASEIRAAFWATLEQAVTEQA
jgi:lysophospholipase L1-like esterase